MTIDGIAALVTGGSSGIGQAIVRQLRDGGGHVAVLGPGDWVEVPNGVMHNATVIGDEPVVSLDAVKRNFPGAIA